MLLTDTLDLTECTRLIAIGVAMAHDCTREAAREHAEFLVELYLQEEKENSCR